MNRVDNINRGMSEMKPLNSIEIPSVEGKVAGPEAQGAPARSELRELGRFLHLRFGPVKHRRIILRA